MAVRILLADDELIVRQGVRTLLEQAGFAVVAEAESRLLPRCSPIHKWL